MAEDDFVFVFDAFKEHVKHDHGEDNYETGLKGVFLSGRIHANYYN